MQGYRALLTVLTLGVVALFSVGCESGDTGGGPAAAGEELQWLESTKAELDAKRAELAELRAAKLEAPPATSQEEGGEAEGAAAEEGAEGEGAAAEGAGEARGDDLDARIAALEEEITVLSEEFGGRLVAYINSLEIAEGEPLTAVQQEAIRMKSDEDIEVAKEWIEKGGDYKRAISIYEQQLQWDPDNERLKQALAEAEEMRYMTAERFEQVADGMTRAEVKAILGPVNLRNIVEYPERNVVGWFYPREDGSASGVYFRLDDETGEYKIYQRTFEVKTEAETEEEEEPEG